MTIVSQPAAAAGAAASQANEAEASLLVNGGLALATHFDGSSAPGGWAWTTYDSNGLAGAHALPADVVGNSVFGITFTSGVNLDGRFTRAFVPAGAFELHARLQWVFGGTSNVFLSGGGLALVIATGTTGTPDLIGIGVASDTINVAKLTSGAWTSPGSQTITGAATGLAGHWLYVRIIGNAAQNSYQCDYSFDRKTWRTIATVAQSLVVTVMGLRVAGNNGVDTACQMACDFIDTVS